MYYTQETFKSKKGFTIIEMLTVMGIIAILASLALVSFGSAQRKARDTQRKNDLKRIQVALESYRSDSSQYPYTNATTSPPADAPSAAANSYKIACKVGGSLINLNWGSAFTCDSGTYLTTLP